MQIKFDFYKIGVRKVFLNITNKQNNWESGFKRSIILGCFFAIVLIISAISSSMSFCSYRNISALNLSTPKELHILLFINQSNKLDSSTEAPDIDVSRKSCKTFIVFENICMHDDVWCKVFAMVLVLSLLRVQCVFLAVASWSNEAFVESKSVPNWS